MEFRKGLTEQQIVEIFDKYKIFDTPEFGNPVSNGIGLTLTKSLNGRLRSQIQVGSELGRHFEFSFIIRFLPADSPVIISDEK